MQNRYLFRGKRIDNGEWEIGYLYCTQNHAYISNDHADMVEVNKDTVCQCTGAGDKNVNLIFENDIMQAYLDDQFLEDVTRVRVLWHENGWCTNQFGCADYEELDDFTSKCFEVVGNVFDNPELLEAQE